MTDELVPTAASEIRAKRMKTWQSPSTGYVYKYRPFESVDAVRMDWFPSVLEDEAKISEGKPDSDAVRKELDFQERLVEACVIEPRITRDRKKVDENTVHVDEIGDDISPLSGKIMEEHVGKVVASSEASDSAEIS